MSRSFSAATVRSMMSQNAEEVFLVLLEITGDGVTPIRVVNNNENIVSGGNTYQAFFFNIALPQDVAEEVRPITLTITNVDRRIIDELRAIETPLTAEFSVIAASSPSTIEYGPLEFKIRNATYNAETITATLALDDGEDLPFPGRSFDPQSFPALFGRL